MSKHDRASKGAVVVALGGLALSAVMGVRLHRRAVERAHARMAAQHRAAVSQSSSLPEARVAPSTGDVVEQTRSTTTEGLGHAADGYDGETAGFSPSGRWAVVRTRDEASTLFVDVNTRAAHAISGARFITTQAPSSTIVTGSEEDFGGSPTERSAPRFSADERFVYGFVGGSLRVFDIESHTNTALDEPRAGVEPQPSANDRSLAWPCRSDGSSAVCFYDFASATLRRVALPSEASDLLWLSNELLAAVPAPAAAGTSPAPSSLYVLSAYTGSVESYRGASIRSFVELSSDGRYIAAQQADRGLVVYRRGSPEPVYSWNDDEGLGWKWQAGGAAIAWIHASPEVEPTGDDGDADGERPRTLEVQWLDENRHASARTTGRCSIADEYITSFEGDELRTELECSPGCPSIAVHSDLRLYNAREARFVRDLPSIDGPSPRDENDAQQRTVTRMLRSAGAVGAGVQGHYDAAAGTLLVQHARGVTLVSRGRAPTRFQQTGDGTGWTMTRSADGARWLGVGPDSSAVIWDAATGLVRWTSRDGDEQGC